MSPLPIAGYGGNRSASSHSTDYVITRVGYVDIAGGIHGNADRSIETGTSRWASVPRIAG
jgi:CO dehydrogenase/acetyl-CoA synthase alpha subunit